MIILKADSLGITSETETELNNIKTGDYFQFSRMFATKLNGIELETKEAVAEVVFHTDIKRKEIVIDKLSTVNLNFGNQGQPDDDLLNKFDYEGFYSGNSHLKVVKGKKWFKVKGLGEFAMRKVVDEIRKKQFENLSLCSSMTAVPFYERTFEKLEAERKIAAYSRRADAPWMFDVVM